MFISLKRSELLKIVLMLKEFMNNDKEYSKQFNIFLETNYNRLIEDVKITLKSKPEKSEEYIKYENEVNKLQIEMAKKDENGEVVQRMDGAYAIPIDKKIDYENRLLEIERLYENEINMYNEELKEYDEVLNEEVNENIVKISFKNLPEKYDYIYTELLMKFVKEDVESIEDML